MTESLLLHILLWKRPLWLLSTKWKPTPSAVPRRVAIQSIRQHFWRKNESSPRMPIGWINQVTHQRQFLCPSDYFSSLQHVYYECVFGSCRFIREIYGCGFLGLKNVKIMRPLRHSGGRCYNLSRPPIVLLSIGLWVTTDALWRSVLLRKKIFGSYPFVWNIRSFFQNKQMKSNVSALFFCPFKTTSLLKKSTHSAAQNGDKRFPFFVHQVEHFEQKNEARKWC